MQLDLSSDASEIEEAIGVAAKVVCAIGAAENDAFNFKAPYKIDGEATKELIRAGGCNPFWHPNWDPSHPIIILY